MWFRRRSKGPAAPPPPPRDLRVHPLLPQAAALHQAGRLTEAAQLYRQILEESPQQFDASHLLGVIAMQEGRLEEAQLAISEALKTKPDDQPALANLCTAYLRSGNFKMAAKIGEQAARIVPASLDALINYGSALYQLQRFEEAARILEIARQLFPRSFQVCELLGASLLKTGDLRAAIKAFETASEIAPTDPNAWRNLSTALKANSEDARAQECAARAASLSGDPSNVLVAQATTEFENGKVEESIATFEKAVAINANLASLCGLIRSLVISGRHYEALQYLQQAMQIDSNYPYVRLLLAVSILKPIYSSTEEIEESRRAFLNALIELQKWSSSRPLADAYQTVGAMQPFFIAYHPFNNRELLMRFGDISVAWMKTLPQSQTKVAPRQGKFSVGIVSSHLYNQSVWNAILKGWVLQIDKSKFELHLYKLGGTWDAQTDLARAHAAHFDDRPRTIGERVEDVRNANLDAIIFDEIGMNATTLQLAALRLAPLQAVTWGHPETSGLSTVDYYLSGDVIEPPEAQRNYTERLVRLPNLGVYIEPLEPKFERADLPGLGLAEDEPLLLCAGSPFKYSPTHDAVWIEIARGLAARKSGRLVFFSDSRGSMNVALIERLRKVFPAAGLKFEDRVQVIPFLTRSRFFALMQSSALMLDTLDFSGFNTAIQALEVGLPYLAFEGEFMRGRLASGLLRILELPELVASSYQDFAERAVALAADPARLNALRDRIRERRARLFHDIAPVRALEQFLETEITRRRTAPR